MDPLHIKGLGIVLDENELFHEFELCIQPNERVAILGPSGCGKSTLLRFIAGLLPAQHGAIKGIETQVIRLVFQEPRLLPWKKVRDNILIGCHTPDKAVEDHLNALLALAELESSQELYPSQLSGGMAQRVSLLRAMVRQPDVLLLDEPFSSLDRQLRKRICQAYLKMSERFPHSLVLVTHQPEEAFELADRIVVLNHRPVQIVGDRPRTSFENLNSLTDWLDEIMAPATE